MGIKISCILVLPKFVHHIRPQLHYLLTASFRSRSATVSASLENQATVGTVGTGGQSIGQKARGRNQYIELEEGRAPPSKDEISGIWVMLSKRDVEKSEHGSYEGSAIGSDAARYISVLAQIVVWDLEGGVLALEHKDSSFQSRNEGIIVKKCSRVHSMDHV